MSRIIYLTLPPKSLQCLSNFGLSINNIQVDLWSWQSFLWEVVMEVQKGLTRRSKSPCRQSMVGWTMSTGENGAVLWMFSILDEGRGNNQVLDVILFSINNSHPCIFWARLFWMLIHQDLTSSSFVRCVSENVWDNFLLESGQIMFPKFTKNSMVSR